MQKGLFAANSARPRAELFLPPPRAVLFILFLPLGLYYRNALFVPFKAGLVLRQNPSQRLWCDQHRQSCDEMTPNGRTNGLTKLSICQSYFEIAPTNQGLFLVYHTTPSHTSPLCTLMKSIYNEHSLIKRYWPSRMKFSWKQRIYVQDAIFTNSKDCTKMALL
jgi:hypothetical protein